MFTYTRCALTNLPQAAQRLDELCFYCELHPAMHSSGAVAALTALLHSSTAPLGAVAAAASAINRLAGVSPDVQVRGGSLRQAGACMRQRSPQQLCKLMGLRMLCNAATGSSWPCSGAVGAAVL